MSLDHHHGAPTMPVGPTTVAAVFYTGASAVFAQANPSDLASLAIFLGSVASVGMMLIAASREAREWFRPGTVRPLPAPPPAPTPPPPPVPGAAR